jgi:hypothetical protein
MGAWNRTTTRLRLVSHMASRIGTLVTPPEVVDCCLHGCLARARCSGSHTKSMFFFLSIHEDNDRIQSPVDARNTMILSLKQSATYNSSFHESYAIPLGEFTRCVSVGLPDTPVPNCHNKWNSDGGVLLGCIRSAVRKAHILMRGKRRKKEKRRQKNRQKKRKKGEGDIGMMARSETK